MIENIFWWSSLEGLAALLVLAFLPSDLENRVLWFYSGPRLGMMLAALVLMGFCFLLARKVRHSHTLSGHLEMLSKRSLLVLGSWALAIALTVLAVTAIMPFPSNLSLTVIRRSLPLLVWAAAFAWQWIHLEHQLSAPTLPAIWRRFLYILEMLARQYASILRSSAVPFVITGLLGALLLGSVAWKNQYPLGYAGLFTWMSELIAKNRFALPVSVAFYGPGGMPFAYPPVGLYLMAFFTQILRVPELAYLRYAPAVFSLLALAPFQSAVARIENDAIPARKGYLTGMVAALLLVASPRLYMAQGEAAGVVRALGFFFSMSSLFATICFLRKPGFLIGSLAVLSLALTLMTHMNDLLFLAVMLGALVFSGESPVWKRMGWVAVIVLGGVLVSMPWWLTIIHRYSLGVFLNAAFSHGDFILFRPDQFLQHVLSDSLPSLYRSPFLAGGLVFGSLYNLVQKRWFYPLATLGVLILPLGDWLLAPFAAAMSAQIVVELSHVLYDRRQRLIPAALFISLVAGLGMLDGYRQIQQIDPIVDGQTLAVGKWIGRNTPASSSYLFFTASADEAEWMPWLAKRTPSVGSWGAEWIGDYQAEFGLLNEVADCAVNDPQSCASDLADRLKPDYLIASKRNSASSIKADLSSLSGWKVVYENEEYSVWESPRQGGSLEVSPRG